jgi:hypothetical protein
MTIAPLPGTNVAHASAASPDLHAVLVGALWRGAMIVVGTAAVVGGLLFGPLAALPGEAVVYYAGGTGLALFAGMLALVLHGRFLDPRATAPFAGDARLLAGRLQGLLAAAFAAKLVVLVVAFLVLRQLGAKFADTATFCITFAGGALMYQVVTAVLLARAVQPRPGASPGGSRS